MTKLTPKLSELAALISEKAAYLEAYLERNNLPQPSFAANGPSTFAVPETDQETVAARYALLDATEDLQDLVLGPDAFLKQRSTYDFKVSACLHAVYHFKIAQAVPLTDDGISIADLSRAVAFDEMNLARILRLCIMEHIFAEPEPGIVVHSAISRYLATNKGTQDVVGHMMEGAFTSSARMVECLEKFTGSQHPEHSAWTLNFGAPFFEYMARHPQLMDRFAGCMTGWSGNVDTQAHVNEGFDWAGLGDGLVVDVGGSRGQLSIALAEAFPRLRFQVQDLPYNEGPATAAIGVKGLVNRIEFVAHDFFEPLPESAKSASVYFLRYIVHDWSDELARKILRNVVDAMAPHSRLVIADGVLPPAGVLPQFQERMLRSFDISMFIQLNARERAMEDWTALLHSVDPKLTIAGVKAPPPGISFSILDIRFRDA